MAHEELKQRQSVMWGNAPFVSIAETITDLHRAVAEALAPSDGESVLDIGCGTGGVTELMAGSGARIVGVDLAPGLIEIAEERARERGLDIEYHVGDCENLLFDDASFDAAGSSVGIMFSPDHAASASELARVVKPGGRIALANWKPGSPGVQDLFKLMGPFQPAPPPSSPFDWGDESRVHELLDDAFDIQIAERVNVVRYPSAEDYWVDFADNYGPTKTLVDGLGDRAGELHDAWLAFFGDGPTEQQRPYVLVTGTRR